MREHGPSECKSNEKEMRKAGSARPRPDRAKHEEARQQHKSRPGDVRKLDAYIGSHPRVEGIERRDRQGQQGTAQEQISEEIKQPDIDDRQATNKRTNGII